MKNQKENRLVVANAGWAETIPEWLLEEVRFERTTLGLITLIKPDCKKVGDAEVCVYLYTLGLTQPMSTEYNEIYIYLTAKLLKQKGKTLVDSMEEKLNKGLTEWQKRELEQLRETIYKTRGDINHPLLNAMRELRNDLTSTGKIETGEKSFEKNTVLQKQDKEPAQLTLL
ncbi:MAG: hypothetical protein AB1393_13790 [Candidatus Edwardsbacteria bacterium]